MSIENGKDYRNWLRGDPVQLAETKERKRLLRFKIMTFNYRIAIEKKNWKKLLDGQQGRYEYWKPKYKTREELDEAYVAGIVTDEDYPRERYAIWQVYSDRGHKANLEWLESEQQKYQAELDGFEAFLQKTTKENKKKYDQRHRKKYLYRRREKRRKARERIRKDKWKKYGIGRRQAWYK